MHACYFHFIYNNNLVNFAADLKVKLKVPSQFKRFVWPRGIHRAYNRRMGTKMKGLLKGLRYISQIFDEEKEKEIQIGFPTDVKHVAHIGWDGPSSAVDNSPSWMKEFKPAGGAQSAPLDASGNPIVNHEDKWG